MSQTLTDGDSAVDSDSNCCVSCLSRFIFNTANNESHSGELIQHASSGSVCKPHCTTKFQPTDIDHDVAK